MDDITDLAIYSEKQCNSIEKLLKHECGQCDNVFSGKSELMKHMKIHNGENIHHCNQCDKTFTLKKNLTRHTKERHNGEKPYQCSECDKVFSRELELNKHMKIHNGDDIHQCKQCNKVFTLKRSLTRHIKMHYQEKPYQCSVCDKTFTVKSNLTRHTKERHSRENPYQCNVCNKYFQRKDHLQQHILSHNANSYCTQCDKSFHRNSDYIIHISGHTVEKLYHCSECDKAFPKNSKLIKHMVVHTGEKKHGCSQCSKSFSTHSYLVRHMRIHTGEKPYQCSHCESAFSLKTILKTHLKLHLDEYGTSKKNKATKCTKSTCTAIFYHHKDLIQHLKVKHDEDYLEIQHVFTTMVDFYIWKESEETKNYVYYSKQCATKKGKTASYMYYICQKSGSSRNHYKKGEAHRKSSRRNKKGVVKTDTLCPSRMKCKIDHLTGTINVTYMQTHSHQIHYEDTQHHPIPRSMVEKVENRLLSGSTAKEIFKDLQKEKLSTNKENIHIKSQQKHISMRSIKKIAEKLKLKDNKEFQNHESHQEGSNRHKTGIGNSDVDIIKVSDKTWHCRSYTTYNKEDRYTYKIEFIMPFCGSNSCSDKSDKPTTIGLCSHMYQCSCREKSDICSHVHKVHSSRKLNDLAHNIVTSEVVVGNDVISNQNYHAHSIERSEVIVGNDAFSNQNYQSHHIERSEALVGNDAVSNNDPNHKSHSLATPEAIVTKEAASNNDYAHNIVKSEAVVSNYDVSIQNCQAHSIATSEALVTNGADSNNDDLFSNIADFKVEHYDDDNQELNNEINLRATALKNYGRYS